MSTPPPPQIDVYFGAPLSDRTEQRFLARLKADLQAGGEDAVVFVNLTVGPRSQQIDAVIATAQGGLVVEIKGYATPVRGGLNGAWIQELADGTQRRLDARNPYQQASDGRFAIADALKALSGEDNKTALSAVVCLYPEPPQGSEIPPGDFKAWIGGYERALELVGEAASRPIPLDDWRALATKLRLTPEGASLTSDNAKIVGDYRLRQLDLARKAVGPYAAVTVSAESGSMDIDAVAQRLIAGDQFQLIGPSGCGKTAWLQALAASVSERGFVAIPIAARHYDGTLAPLLRRGVAVATARGVDALISAADTLGAPTLILVDAVNECRADLRPELLAALQAARLKYGAQVVLTGQETLELPLELAGLTLGLDQPTPDQVRAIVEARLGRSLQEPEQNALEVVRTANDAAVLAEVIRDPKAVDGRHALYAAFVRRRLGENAISRASERSLRILAAHMRSRFVSIVSRSAAADIMAATQPAVHDPDGVYAHVLAAGVLHKEGESLRFRHDLFADFFAAGQLLVEQGDPDVLSLELIRPINMELAEFATGGCGSTQALEAILDRASTRLLAACLRGDCGGKARQFVLDRCLNLLERLVIKHAALRFCPRPDPTRPGRYAGLECISDPSELITGRDERLLRILPLTVREGLLPGILSMLRRISDALRGEAGRLAATYPEIRFRWEAAVMGEVYGVTFGPGSQDLQQLFQATKLSLFGRRENGDIFPLIVSTLEASDSPDFGEMFFLFEALSGFDDFNRPPPENLIALLDRAWSSRIYHLQLLATDIAVRLGSRLDEDRKDVLGDLIGSWFSSSNPMMNGSIFDALRAIDRLEDAIEIQDVVAEFEAALALPDGADASEEAFTLYSHTIDHPYDHVYSEAFADHLDDTQRRILRERAFAAPRAFSMFKAFLAAEIFQDPSPGAIPALLSSAGAPEVETMSVQDSVSIHLHAVGALARLGVQLPQFVCTPGTAGQAWEVGARVVYELNRSDSSSTAQRAAWDHLEALGAPLAFDVVVKIVEDPSFFRRADLGLVARFEHGLLHLARQVLATDYTPSLLFASKAIGRDDLTRHRRFALELVGRSGRPMDLSSVRHWLEDPELGGFALEAARQIEART